MNLDGLSHALAGGAGVYLGQGKFWLSALMIAGSIALAVFAHRKGRKHG